MRILPYTKSNVKVVQEFIDETINRITNGVSITFTKKAQNELEDLSLNHEITTDDIEFSLLNLKVENYFRGIDPSGRADFNVCAFCTTIGVNNIKIYLKYGLETNGLQLLIFSNHPPQYPMVSPFKK